jgi:FAD/FMN-containing dehydrogenase
VPEKIIAGDVESSDEIREKYSHDASLFEVVPEVVVFPKNTQDVQAVVNFVREHKKDIPNLSITARSAGTCRMDNPER